MPRPITSTPAVSRGRTSPISVEIHQVIMYSASASPLQQCHYVLLGTVLQLQMLGAESPYVATCRSRLTFRGLGRESFLCDWRYLNHRTTDACFLQHHSLHNNAAYWLFFLETLAIFLNTFVSYWLFKSATVPEATAGEIPVICDVADIDAESKFYCMRRTLASVLFSLSSDFQLTSAWNAIWVPCTAL